MTQIITFIIGNVIQHTHGGAYNGYSSGWAKIYYSNNWVSSHDPEYDWCISVLYEDLGSHFGWYACQTYGNNSDFNGRNVRTLGYPGDLENGQYQYYSFGSVSNTHDRYFDSSSRVVGGFSGGPIYQTSDNYIIGVVHRILYSKTSCYLWS